jgi:hypothetical protein
MTIPSESIRFNNLEVIITENGDLGLDAGTLANNTPTPITFGQRSLSHHERANYLWTK